MANFDITPNGLILLTFGNLFFIVKSATVHGTDLTYLKWAVEFSLLSSREYCGYEAQF